MNSGKTERRFATPAKLTAARSPAAVGVCSDAADDGEGSSSREEEEFWEAEAVDDDCSAVEEPRGADDEEGGVEGEEAREEERCRLIEELASSSAEIVKFVFDAADGDLRVSNESAEAAAPLGSS